MTDDEIVRMMREHFEGLFPRVCPSCGRSFATLRDYILATSRVGPTISFDAAAGNWKPERPVGALALSNCPCGTTLGLSTKGMPLDKIHRVLEWVKIQTETRGISPEDVVGEVRDEIRRRALAEPGPADA